MTHWGFFESTQPTKPQGLFRTRTVLQTISQITIIDLKMLNLYKRNKFLMVLSPRYSDLQKCGTEVKIYFRPNVFPGVTIQHQSPGRQSMTSSA